MNKKKAKKHGKRERSKNSTAVSCSLVLKDHIFFPLISNALVNSLSHFIATTSDLSLAACGKKKKVQIDFRGNVLLWASCPFTTKSIITLGRCTS